MTALGPERPAAPGEAAGADRSEPDSAQPSATGPAARAGEKAEGDVRAEGRMRLLAARMWVARHRPYYARALFACPIELTYETRTLAIYDHWHIEANPRFAASHTVGEVAAGLIHELNHLLRDHSGRFLRSGLPDEALWLWRIAAEFEINDDLRDDGLEMPVWALYPEAVGLEPGRTAEQYYRDMLDMARPPDHSAEQMCDHDYRVSDDDSGADGKDRGDERPSLARREQLRRQAARDVIDHQRAHGEASLPEGLGRWAATLTEPKLDWRRLLASEVRKGVRRRPGTGDADWARPPRRPDESPVLRPGTARPAADIAVIVDTSSSMRPADHSQALTEIQAILRAAVPGEAVRVHSADVGVITSQDITQARQIRLAGGVGTDMGQAVIDAAAARPRPAVIIVITDGGTTWPPARPPEVAGTVIVVLTRPDWACEVPRWITAVHAYATGP